jgi:hypothetical protein
MVTISTLKKEATFRIAIILATKNKLDKIELNDIVKNSDDKFEISLNLSETEIPGEFRKYVKNKV